MRNKMLMNNERGIWNKMSTLRQVGKHDTTEEI